MIHKFASSLAESHAAADLPCWEEMYRKAFPNFAAMVDHREDGPHQRNGIDRSVILSNAKQVLIDEKIRGRNKITGIVYSDIALEYLSDTDRKTPGWVCKPLLADYIAYAIGPIGKGYLLPVIQLQSAWKKHGNEWIRDYKRIRSQNDGWLTTSVGVPVDVLFRAIGSMLRLEFDPFEDTENKPRLATPKSAAGTTAGGGTL